MHLVVQGQRVVALAPVVTDARLAIHDQRIDLQLGQARSDRKPCLPAAHDQHGGVPVRIFGGGIAQIEPVRPAEVARIGFALRPRPADAFLHAAQFIERSEQRPRLWRLSISAIRSQAQHAAAAADGGFEAEDRFERFRARARHAPRRRSLRVHLKARRLGARGVRLQLACNAIETADGPDLPRQREHIAPMAIGMEQCFEGLLVGARNRLLELREPSGRNRCVVFRCRHERILAFPRSRPIVVARLHGPHAPLATASTARKTTGLGPLEKSGPNIPQHASQASPSLIPPAMAASTFVSLIT